MRLRAFVAVLLIIGAAVVPLSAAQTGGSCSTTLVSGESVVAAVLSAEAGATVCLSSGTYPTAVLRSVHKSGPVTVRPVDGAAPNVAGVDIDGASRIRFQGLRLTGQNTVKNAAHIAFVDDEFARHPLWIEDSADVLVEGNHFHDMPSGNTRKISLRSMHDTRLTVRGNRFERGCEDPIQLTDVVDGVVERNTMKDFQPCAGEHTDTIHVLGAEGLVIRSNYAENIAHGLMFTDFVPSGVRIENNVQYRVTNGFAWNMHSTNMPGCVGVNNTIVESRYGIESSPCVLRNVVTDDSLPSGCDHCVSTSDPSVFADVAARDFDPAQGGPLHETGSLVDAPAVDRLGRIRDATPDIGAHELNGVAPTPSPSACSNGLDDDGDGFVDVADAGCINGEDNDEVNAVSTLPSAPVARYTYSPSAPAAGQRVTFDARASSCVDTPCIYRWEDDGPDGPGGQQWPLGSGQVLEFTFGGAGTKSVRLRVADASGQEDATVQTVSVSNSPAPDPEPQPEPDPEPQPEPPYSPACAPTCDEQIARLTAERDDLASKLARIDVIIHEE